VCVKFNIRETSFVKSQFRTAAVICGLLWFLSFVPAQSAERDPNDAPVPKDLKPIGGKWFVTSGENPVYYYRDGKRFVDLFSYHKKDSNKDGIDNVRLSHDGRFLIMHSQGYPNHPTAVFPNSGNPNSILVQNFTFRLPLEPKLADHITRAPMGPIGAALNGVVFFNPFEMEGMNAVEGYSEVWLDSCCGHPQQSGVYHYHKYPSCVKSPFADDGKQHSPIIGFAWDGFPVHGPYEEAGVKAKDLKGNRALDVCNGHSDEERGYHYHVTPGRFPYIIGGYAGVVEPSNNRGLNRAGTGAVQDNTQRGENRMDKVITTVRPGTASRGKTHSIQFVLNPANARRQPVPNDKPSWGQIGPFEATKIARDGNVVTIEIKIPDDAPVGVLFDCHLEFDDPSGRFGPIVFKKNDVFRVVE
jgi:YHYH protein